MSATADEILVSVKWEKEVYEDVTLDRTLPIIAFKETIQSLTGVEPERQTVLVRGGKLKDNKTWANYKVREGDTVKVMGSRGNPVKPEDQDHLFTHLPPEILLCVFDFLDTRDLLRCKVVCSEWYQVAADNYLWRPQCEEAGWEPTEEFKGGHRYHKYFIENMTSLTNWSSGPVDVCHLTVPGSEDADSFTCLETDYKLIGASCTSSGLVHFWSRSTGKYLNKIVTGASALSSFTFHMGKKDATPSILLTASMSEGTRVFDIMNARCLLRLSDRQSSAIEFYGGRDGHKDAALSGERGGLRVYDVETGAGVVSVEREAAVNHICVDGAQVVTLTDMGIDLIDVRAGEVALAMENSAGMGQDRNMGLKGNLLVKAVGLNVSTWDIRTGKVVANVNISSRMDRVTTYSVEGLDMDSQRLVTLSTASASTLHRYGLARVYDMRNGECIRWLDDPARIWDSKEYKFDPIPYVPPQPMSRVLRTDHEMAFAALHYGDITVWNLAGGKLPFAQLR